MYSRKHGKSGSTKPRRQEPPEWVDMSAEEVEEKVVELADEGKPPAEIGIVLRDKYGIPSTKDVVDKSVTQILEENDAGDNLPEDLRNLLDRAEEIRSHLENHPNDSSAIHGLEQAESKIRRLKKYYRNEGRIPQDWEYSPRSEITVKGKEQ